MVLVLGVMNLCLKALVSHGENGTYRTHGTYGTNVIIRNSIGPISPMSPISPIHRQWLDSIRRRYLPARALRVRAAFFAEAERAAAGRAAAAAPPFLPPFLAGPLLTG